MMSARHVLLLLFQFKTLISVLFGLMLYIRLLLLFQFKRRITLLLVLIMIEVLLILLWVIPGLPI